MVNQEIPNASTDKTPFPFGWIGLGALLLSFVIYFFFAGSLYAFISGIAAIILIPIICILFVICNIQAQKAKLLKKRIDREFSIFGMGGLLSSVIVLFIKDISLLGFLVLIGVVTVLINFEDLDDFSSPWKWPWAGVDKK